jgi:hypothetical protein
MEAPENPFADPSESLDDDAFGYFVSWQMGTKPNICSTTKGSYKSEEKNKI